MDKLITNEQLSAYLATTHAGNYYNQNTFDLELANKIYKWLESKKEAQDGN